MFLQIGWLLAVMVAAAQNQTLEASARAIDGKVMAPCCWSGTVAQHSSQVAEEMRRQTRAMLAAGKSEREILDYYVSVYGERILASPRPRGFNLLVWILPWVFLISGAVYLVTLLRKWTRNNPVIAEAGLPAAPLLDDRTRIRIERELKNID